MNLTVLILGSDINAYYMARCCHEYFNKKVHMIGKQFMNFTGCSKIIDLTIYPDLQEVESFKRILKNFYDEHKDEKILLIGSNDTYVRLIIENQEFLKQYFIYPYFDETLLNNLLVKENFYKNMQQFPIPDTYIYDINSKLDEKRVSTFGYPLILKPSDGVLYHEHEFATQHKVYKIKSHEELLSVIKDIKDSGYTGTLIIQKFIKGDDSHLFDCVAFIDRHHKVKLMSFAQIALQEHTITGIGNATVLVNGVNTFGSSKEFVNKLKGLLETLNYHGFLEVDIKYDEEEKAFKVLEINPRQARSSYYLAFAGYNLVKYLVEDLVLEKDLDFTFIDKEIGLSFVPKAVIKKHVENVELKNEILKLFKEKKMVNPLKYKKDNLLKRNLWLKVRDVNYIRKYKRNSW